MKRKIEWIVSLAIIVPLLAVFLGVPGAVAQGKYPSKPVTVIVPWSVGGSTDMVARVGAKILQEKWGVSVNVTAKPGGKGIPGTVEALSAAPNGYTLLADADGSNAIPAAWGKDVPFKIEDRTYIAKIAEFPWVFAIRSGLNWKSLDDVAAAVKANPEGIKWGWLGGTAGADGPVGQMREALKKKGIDVSKVKMVTYPGGADLVTAIAGGHVDIGSASTTSVGPMFSAGKIKLIAITGERRYPGYPDLRSTVEQGWKTVTFQGHVGFAGPKGLPADIVKAIEDPIKAAIDKPEIKADLAKIGAVPAYAGSQDFRTYVLNLAAELKEMK
ncbi:MAG: tripartite tricarboxylate transporter substrate binding protein [Deltaproteobacteria bacterium]|nr:tripartite tricarboxylate transporter substrate binding protein [Deltaproteobacteria bacterium]